MTAARRLCTFTLDELFLGVDVDHVQEVIRYLHVTPVPLAPRAVDGLINLRGQIVTAIDLRRKLDLRTRSLDRAPFNVVVRTKTGPVSLLVDEIGDVVELSEESFEKPPDTLEPKAREVIIGAFKLPGRLLLMLNLDRALDLSAS